MRRQVARRSGLSLASLCGALSSAPEAALADGVEGPPIVAWYPNYNKHQNDVGRHGSHCLNRETRMPAGRQTHCGHPELTELGTGRYLIGTENGAPFPEGVHDSGFLVFVTPVGSTAHCFEEEARTLGTAFESVVRCVDPISGSDVESDWSWAYRADSVEYPQELPHTPNVAYARVRPNGSLVDSESFNPLELRPEDIRVQRNGVGDYSVVFRDMNPLEAALEPELSPYNVLVQKTCIEDVDGGADLDGCFRAVCVPEDWTPGDFVTPDTMIEVRCYAADGLPRDTGFRVLFGDEGFNSQGNWEGGYRHGWADWSIAQDAPGCYLANEVMSNSQHETPPSFFPGLPVEACRESTGRYHVNFHSYITPYSIDGMNVVVSSRAPGGNYCSAEQLLCAEDAGVCGIPDTVPTTRVVITCFDPAGQPADARWTMNMTY